LTCSLPAERQAALFGWLLERDVSQLVLLVLAVLLVVDAVLLGVALARFQRSRLILD
jgi:hypothetical protein